MNLELVELLLPGGYGHSVSTAPQAPAQLEARGYTSTREGGAER